MAERVVIVGAGQAGAQVAISLRQLGFAGEVVLLGEEPAPPYQRPPLSKALLSGEMAPERTLIRSRGLLRQERDRAAPRQSGSSASCRSSGRSCCAGGETLPYDVLVLCTGTGARRLALPGERSRRACSTCARWPMRRASGRPSGRGARAVIVGGGYIGLEVAASLTQARLPRSRWSRRSSG